jgi:hypothetical protein
VASVDPTVTEKLRLGRIRGLVVTGHFSGSILQDENRPNGAKNLNNPILTNPYQC